MKYEIFLTIEELEKLKELKKKHKDKRIFKRLHCIELKNEGMVNRRIAESLDVSERTVITWYKMFIEGGFEELCHFNYKPRKSYLEDYSDEIEEYINEENISSSKKLQQILFERHNLVAPASTIRGYLKKNTLIKKQG